jgi:hypothetical protein
MTASQLRTELKNQQIAGRSAAKTKEQMIALLVENGITEIEHKPSFNSAFDFSNLDTSTPQLSDEEIEADEKAIKEAAIEAAFANNQPPVLTAEQLEEEIEIEDNGYVFTHPFNYDDVVLVAPEEPIEEPYIDPEEHLPFNPEEAIEYCIQVALDNQAFAEEQIIRLNAEILEQNKIVEEAKQQLEHAEEEMNHAELGVIISWLLLETYTFLVPFLVIMCEYAEKQTVTYITKLTRYLDTKTSQLEEWLLPQLPTIENNKVVQFVNKYI